MKLYKFLVSALMLSSVAWFTSCNNEEEDIFDHSAAQRLDEYKRLYSSDLTSEGGRWLMEYFANEEEFGYVFVMTFNTDGSVKISGQNIWMDSQYKSDVSLWSIITDNGPVLSFNTYNAVFHEFSTPENITGPYAPTNPDNNNEDIDEQGTGHGGDYEFVILGLSEDGKTMHLTGKKTLFDIYMHRLDASVDEKVILEQYLTAPQRFDARFKDLSLFDKETGEEFIISNISTGIISAYPKAGDNVTQTSTANAILYPDGFRFMKPFEVERANSDETISFQTFKLADDGTLVCQENENFYIKSGELSHEYSMNSRLWTVSLETAGGKYAEMFQSLKSRFHEVYPNKRELKSIQFAYEIYDGKLTPYVNLLAGTTFSHFYLTCEVTSGVSVKYGSIGISDKNGQTFLRTIPEISSFLDLISSSELELSSDNVLYPSRMKLTSKADQNDYFYVVLN